MMQGTVHTAVDDDSAVTEKVLRAPPETAEEEQRDSEVQEQVDLEAAETEGALDVALEGYLREVSENSDSELALLCPSEQSSSGPPPLEAEEEVACVPAVDRL